MMAQNPGCLYTALRSSHRAFSGSVVCDTGKGAEGAVWPLVSYMEAFQLEEPAQTLLRTR